MTDRWRQLNSENGNWKGVCDASEIEEKVVLLGCGVSAYPLISFKNLNTAAAN